jgi:hypothetical protein
VVLAQRIMGADVRPWFLNHEARIVNGGMLIKPFAECVDNQAAALVLSSYFVGSFFADGPGNGNIPSS